MKNNFTFSCLCLMIGFLYSGIVAGQNPVYIEETFDYEDAILDAASITDLDGGTGWAGSWELQDGDAITFEISDVIASVLGNAKRTFETPLVDNGEEDIWIYAHLRSGTSATAGYAGISIWSGESEDIYIGQEWDKELFSVRGEGWGGTNYTSEVDVKEDVTFLVKIETWEPGEPDNVTVWLNPEIGDEVPSFETASGTFAINLLGTYEFLSLRSDQTILCDFIKIGTDIEKILGLGSSVGLTKKDKLILENYPNPVKTATNFCYSLKENGASKIELFDMNGKIVKTFNNLSPIAGCHLLEVDVTGMKDGIYYYRLTQNNNCQTNKLIVSK
ncbi:MAG: T9SS type A sorting domain-containing protein [Prolixibacteraceae bacterium]|nr:T9SS type A sorting domain-containing protein [Prolixibacteraceae bacterium]